MDDGLMEVQGVRKRRVELGREPLLNEDARVVAEDRGIGDVDGCCKPREVERRLEGAARRRLEGLDSL